MLDEYIYSNVGSEILYCVNNALLECVKIGSASEYLIPENPKLKKCFDSLKSRSFDQHITEGLFNSHQTRGEKVSPRLLKLTINAFKDASDVKVKSQFIIPSPIHILYYALIVPQHSQTAAYSLASCRTLLFNLLEKVYLKNNAVNSAHFLHVINEEAISQAVDSLIRHNNIAARWPRDANLNSIRSYTNLLVGHFLAMKGIAHLSFDSKKEAERFLALKDRKSFLENFSTNLFNARFRVSSKYEELPDTGELINQLFGIPLPIKGAEIVFFGGLKPSSTGGLVFGVSGQAGIGKTSFALSFANSLAPLGIKCFYLSLEENENDIRKRLFSIQTPFEKELSYYRKPADWFSIAKADQTLTLSDLVALVDAIKDKIESDEIPDNSDTNCRSVIVIDNFNAFYDEKGYDKIEHIIDKLRKLRSIIILIGGEGVLEKLRMEYLIDNGINLVHEGLAQKGEKPLRLFNLYKTRHQLSRQGTHIFHMSGDEGFRISPQIPSQMDRKEKLRRYLHDESNVIHTVNYLSENSNEPKVIYRKNGILKTGTRNQIIRELKDALKNSSMKMEPFLKLFPRTHILIHGYGSAGKAGFALKLLLTPPIDTSSYFPIVSNKIPNYSSTRYRRKVLVISFLYPQKYYHELVFEKGIELQTRISKVYCHLEDPILDYLIFYPGYISPEDFINKITRKLDQAILEGQPFTGVLIDGLHNVFLQFVRLQNNDMVWPLLYNILARYDLTVVSTFTNFSMNDRLLDDDQNSKNKILNQALPDHMLLQKGMAPFLHALVKASDFYFFLEQLMLKSGERKYLMSIKGAIGQNVPTELLEWNRQTNMFTGIYSYQEIVGLISDENK